MMALDGHRLIFCHTTTNQQYAGLMEGAWDRPRNHVRMLGEHDGNNEPLAEGNNDNNDKYGKDGNIPDDDDKYAIGIEGVGEPLDKGNNQRCPCMSVPCETGAERALKLRASYSQRMALRV